MNRKAFIVLSAVLLLAAACRQREETAASTETAAPATEATAPATEAAPTTPPAGAESTAPAGAPAAATLASQETNWSGISAEVTEFRRKGNTLTAKVVLRNHSGADAQPEIKYDEVYLMDLAAGKKYEVLKDENGAYIAALRSNWKDRWYEALKPGQAFTLWMKFPAPPADVKSVTLQVPGMAPFEDLPIQDV